VIAAQAANMVPQVLEKVEQIEEACSGLEHMTQEFAKLHQKVIRAIEILKRPPLCNVMVQTIPVESRAKGLQCELNNNPMLATLQHKLQNSHLNAPKLGDNQLQLKIGDCSGNEILSSQNGDVIADSDAPQSVLNQLQPPNLSPAQEGHAPGSTADCCPNKPAAKYPNSSGSLDCPESLQKLQASKPAESLVPQDRRILGKRLRPSMKEDEVHYIVSQVLPRIP
jgi:hypothetical protein